MERTIYWKVALLRSSATSHAMYYRLGVMTVCGEPMTSYRKATDHDQKCADCLRKLST